VINFVLNYGVSGRRTEKLITFVSGEPAGRMVECGHP
jgi:hypothetical protein